MRLRKKHRPSKGYWQFSNGFLSSLKGQQYAGRDPNEGTKKPLNAFLGEIFTGSCGPESNETKLVSEQVSHHPPVTACYLWNEKAGIRAEGYTRQEITFRGTVNIQQIGHAVLHIDEYNEDYLIPLPNVKVKGILTGSPYPELTEPCTIVSSAGYIAEISFSGKGILGFGGKRNYVEAGIYSVDDKERKNALFTAEGSWSESFEIKDSSGEVIDTYNVAAAQAMEFRTIPLDQQDPWESRKAWDGVISSINKGDMRGVADSKNKLETAQRELRKKPDTSEEKWKAVFFRKDDENPVAKKLLDAVGLKFDPASTFGVWKFDSEKAHGIERPWRGQLTPYG